MGSRSRAVAATVRVTTHGAPSLAQFGPQGYFTQKLRLQRRHDFGRTLRGLRVGVTPDDHRIDADLESLAVWKCYLPRGVIARATRFEGMHLGDHDLGQTRHLYSEREMVQGLLLAIG